MGNIIKYYRMLFYCYFNEDDKYKKYYEQISDAYWLISLLQGTNIASILFLVNAFSSFEINMLAFFIVYLIPFIINYFVFLKAGRKKIVSQLEILIANKKKPDRRNILFYIIITVIFLVFSAVLNRFLR